VAMPASQYSIASRSESYESALEVPPWLLAPCGPAQKHHLHTIVLGYRRRSRSIKAPSSCHAIWICGPINETSRWDFSRPGKPTDNAFIEAFNGRLRAQCLNAHWSCPRAEKFIIGITTCMRSSLSSGFSS
jgi:hypothetical protein